MDSLTFIYGYSFNPFDPHFPCIVKYNFDVDQDYEDWKEYKIFEYEESQKTRPIKRKMDEEALAFEAFLQSDMIDTFQLFKNIDHSDDGGCYKWKTKHLKDAEIDHYIHGIEVDFTTEDINLIINHLPIGSLLNKIPFKTTQTLINWYHSIEGRNTELLPRLWGIYHKIG